MPQCYFCRREIALKGRVMGKDVCPGCGRDLHCCVQCRFYDPAYHNQCREPKSEMLRERDKANLCDYFEFSGTQGPAPGSEQEKARQKLDELFRKK